MDLRACFLAFAVFSVLAGPAAGLGLETWELAERLESGQWNERIQAVHELGERGPEAVEGLSKALNDPDWQVRMAAVHWLGRFGRISSVPLSRRLRVERCPLVRMSLLHWMVSEPGGRGDGTRGGDSLEGCESWSWPNTPDYLSRRGKRAKFVRATAPDSAGCQYIQFKKYGRNACPAGTILKGVGTAPYNVKMLEGRMPKAGVALCCPPGAALPSGPGEEAKAADVECRLLPDECPSPWVEMEDPDRRFDKRKDRRFVRTRRHKREQSIWRHCCRPVEAAKAPDPGPSFAQVWSDPRERDAPQQEREVFVGEDPGAGLADVEGNPERAIAKRALKKKGVENDERMQEFDILLASVIDAPPPSEGSAREPAQVRRGPPADAPERGEELPPQAWELSQNDWSPPKRRAEAPPQRAPERSAPEIAVDLSPTKLNLRPKRKKTESLPPVPPSLARSDRVEFPQDGAPGVRRNAPDSELEGRRAGLGGREGRLGGPQGPESRREEEAKAPLRIEDDHGTGEIPHDALPALREMIRDRDARRRVRAAEAIGGLGVAAQGAVPELRRALKDTDPRVRSSAALALGSVTRGSDAAVDDLRRALKDGHIDVRYSAAEALGRIGTPEARKVFYRHMRGAARSFLGGG